MVLNQRLHHICFQKDQLGRTASSRLTRMGRGMWIIVFVLLTALHSPLGAGNLPETFTDFGEVIGRFNENPSRQLFIIGVIHRDSLTRNTRSHTTKVQTEVYKIGDWLIHRNGVELFLPEAFFTLKTSKPEGRKVASEEKPRCSGLTDIETVERRLADDKTFLNAELLLREYHPLILRQIEDKASYDTVRKRTLDLLRNGKSSADRLALKSELDVLQGKRTAAMLQRIPGVIEDEFTRGNIKTRKAVFTIGLSHIQGILRTLKERRIGISSPPSTSPQNPETLAELKLHEENYEVTVILPQTLARDTKLLKSNGLDKIINPSRDPSPALP